MSLVWPDVHVSSECMQLMTRQRAPTAALRRAVKRYVVAMGNLNKLVQAYNTETLLRRLQHATTHAEVKEILHACLTVAFVPATVPSLTPATSQLITLHRAFQSVAILKDTLDHWEPVVPRPPVIQRQQTDWQPPPFSYFTTSLV